MHRLARGRGRAALATLLTLALAGALAPAAGAAEPQSYSNGFEVNTDGWFDATREASDPNGVTSASGDWHAVDVGDGAFTRWGGYSDTFPAAGFSTSVDMYLDVDCPADDTRFDWSSAISNSAGAHRRDFVFNAGCYTSPNHFTISASTNAGRGGSYPANPDRQPIEISTSGWYTFKHRFYNDGGVLAVDMSISDAAGNLVKKWKVRVPEDDIALIGGNRYGWFVQNEFPTLAFDNTELAAGCDADGAILKSGSSWKLTRDCQTSHTIVVPDGVTFDGQGHQITAVDPAGAHFLGAVVKNGGAVLNVTDLRVTASGLANICDGGDARLVGILLENAAGALTGNTVSGVRQGLSGCQEGNAIVVRDLSGPSRNAVTVAGNTVSNYQKNAITASGDGVLAEISGNTITGDGPVDYIAQNGIQVSFGASGSVKGNTVSGNWYSPKDTVACGLLFFDATGVKASSNSLFANEKDQCNFGKGGGNVKPAS